MLFCTDRKQRKSGGSSASTQQSYGYNYYGGTNASAEGSPELRQVRAAINNGDITRAEQLLNVSPDRGAEWNFLMGVVCTRRGWMDDAKRYIETACRMDPSNVEYRNALDMFRRSGYRPAGYHNVRGTMTYGGDACIRLCAAWSCCLLSGGRCFFC